MTSPPDGTGEDLERRVLYGLACEWHAACGVLRPADGRLLRPPLFSLGDMRTRLGEWHGGRREIRISRHLALHHSWDSVREVLLHEMAHQFSMEVLGGSDEPAHGPLFQKACHLLRANPRASGRYPPLDLRHATDAAGPDDKMMERVRKLLALAGSPNRHEAEIAMAKAHELIERHNLGHCSRAAGSREFTSIFAGTPALRHTREDYDLALLLQDFYFVRGIWISAFVREKGRMGRVLEISGTYQNVRLAAYVHEFVRRFISRQWEDYNRKRQLNRHRRSDLAVGILQGFRSRLEQFSQARHDSIPEKTAISRRQDPQLASYFRWRYPRTRGVRGTLCTQDRRVILDGRELGKRLVIHRGIEGQTSRGRLLGGA